MKTSKSFFFLLLIFPFTILLGAIINVPADTSTIQGGIFLASEGDTVLVAEGTYYENINFNGKAITVASQFIMDEDTSYISKTIINGSESENSSVVYFVSSEDSLSILCGLTVTGGTGTLAYSNEPAGGGIICHGSNPVLENLCIRNNSSFYGGGIYLNNSNSRLESLKIINNINKGEIFSPWKNFRNGGSGRGGGIFIFSSNPLIKDTKILYNSNMGNGGGIYCEESTPILENLIISHNSSHIGGGLYSYNSSSDFQNVSIKNNEANFGGGICFNNSKPKFNPEKSTSVYNNDAFYIGRDFYLDKDLIYEEIDIYDIQLDTASVSTSSDFYSHPISKFSITCKKPIQNLLNSDVFVSPLGNDQNSGLSQDEAFKTLYKALSSIQPDADKQRNINLLDGLYSPSTGINFPIYLPTNVRILGESMDSTILNAEDSSRVLYLCDLPQISIENLTIRNGSGSRGGDGTALMIIDSKVKLKNLKIIKNEGRVIWNIHSNLIIENSLITDNNLSNTDVTWHGETLFLSHSSTTEIYNSTIANNNSNIATSYYDDKCTIVNSILSNNQNREIYNGCGILALINCILNKYIAGCVPTFLKNHLYGNPKFIGVNDYRLSEDSPCIDGGIHDTTLIFNNNQDTLTIPKMDFIGAAPDLGVYEFGDPTNLKLETIKLPIRYSLSQNYPNPFNPSTTIEFTLPKSEFVELIVYNILGKEVTTLVSKNLNQGNHTYTFDGKNLASGVYYYHIVAGDYREVKKMILLR